MDLPFLTMMLIKWYFFIYYSGDKDSFLIRGIVKSLNLQIGYFEGFKKY